MKKTCAVSVILGLFCVYANSAEQTALISSESVTNPAIVAVATDVNSGSVPVAGGMTNQSTGGGASYLGAGLVQLAENKGSDKYSPWRSIGALVFILSALFGINLYLRKRGGFGVAGKKDRKIQILDKIGVDSRRFIILVEVEGSRFLVGVGPDGMRSLTTYDTMISEDVAGDDQKVVFK